MFRGEKRAEDAVKESEELKVQLQQVQLKFTGALKQALARNAEHQASSRRSRKPRRQLQRRTDFEDQMSFPMWIKTNSQICSGGIRKTVLHSEMFTLK